MRPILILRAIALTVFVHHQADRREHDDDRQSLGAALFTWILMVPLGIVLALEVVQGRLELIPAVLGVVVFVAPSVVCERVLVPLGWWRAAAVVGRLCHGRFPGDPEGAGLIHAGLAALRSRQPTAAARWIDHKLEDRTPAGANDLLAAGLAAAARGDWGVARRALAGVQRFRTEDWPARTFALAMEISVADAITRAAWAEAVAAGIPPAPRVRPTGTTRFLTAAARRLNRDPDAPTNAELKRGWRRARSRNALLPLLHNAMSAGPEPDPGPEATAPPPLPDPPTLRDVQRRHLHALGHPLTSDRLRDLAAAWDRVLAASPDEAGRLADDVRNELAAAVLRDHIALETPAGDAGMLREVFQQVQDDLLEGLELGGARLDDRVRGGRALPPPAEFAAWAGLLDGYHRASTIGGLTVRRHAYGVIHGPVCNLAVWLWNERGQRPLGHAMFHWLLEEARIVDDEEAVALHQRNVACGA